MSEKKQVEKSHYEFKRYMGKGRWNSVWHQIDEVIELNPEKVLEIGPGPGVFKKIGNLFGISVETLDIDPELAPDHVGSATALPFVDDSHDVVCAFQMLEHLPYEKSIKAFREMVRVSKAYVVISLPDSKPVWRYRFYIPKLGVFDWLMPRPFAKPQIHKFDGEHHWEIGKQGFELKRIVDDFSFTASLKKTYRVKENSYHRFFVFEKR